MDVEPLAGTDDFIVHLYLGTTWQEFRLHADGEVTLWDEKEG